MGLTLRNLTLSSLTMGGAAAPAGDPYWDNVVLLLHADGTDASTTIIDSSSKQRTMVAHTNSQLSTAQFKFGPSSLWIDNGWVSSANSTDFALGSNNFTIEMWFMETATNPLGELIGQHTKPYGSSDDAYLFMSNNGQIAFGLYTTSGNFGVGSPTAHTLNEWHFAAVVRNANILTLYIDGISVSTADVGTSVVNTVTEALSIGKVMQGSDNPDPGNYVFNGYIDELRFTNGVARYTSNFSVPTAPFPDTAGPATVDPYWDNVTLLMHGNGTNGSTTFIDSSISQMSLSAIGSAQISTVQSKFGGAASYFPSNGYVTAVPNTGFDMGTDNTFEAWVYYTAGVAQGIISYSTTAHPFMRTMVSYIWYITAAGLLEFSVNGPVIDTEITVSTVSIPSDTWTHIAVVKVGQVFTQYINGVSASSATFNNSGNSTDSSWSFRVGTYYTDALPFNGYIDDLRITKGVARYISDFAVPTAQFPDGPLLPAAPVASFTADASTGTIPFTVHFTDTSTNTPTSWAWAFGEGQTSTAQNPSHAYTATGTYYPSLTVTNAGGSSTYTQTTPINVGQVPTTFFVADVTSGPTPLTVNFTDESASFPTSWAWNFGDGNTSTAQNPSHTYTTVGSYTVTETATNMFGSSSWNVGISATTPPGPTYQIPKSLRFRIISPVTWTRRPRLRRRLRRGERRKRWKKPAICERMTPGCAPIPTSASSSIKMIFS